MNRQFCLTHTVRYDECNCDGLLSPTAFLRYMQEIAARDAEDARLAGEGYWVIKRTVMNFAVPIPIHTQLELKTYGTGFTRITAQRGYEAHRATAVLATSVIRSQISRSSLAFIPGPSKQRRIISIIRGSQARGKNLMAHAYLEEW